MLRVSLPLLFLADAVSASSPPSSSDYAVPPRFSSPRRWIFLRRAILSVDEVSRWGTFEERVTSPPRPALTTVAQREWLPRDAGPPTLPPLVPPPPDGKPNLA